MQPFTKNTNQVELTHVNDQYIMDYVKTSYDRFFNYHNKMIPMSFFVSCALYTFMGKSALLGGTIVGLYHYGTRLREMSKVEKLGERYFNGDMSAHLLTRQNKSHLIFLSK